MDEIIIDKFIVAIGDDNELIRHGDMYHEFCEKQPEYACPECNEILFLDEAAAIAFLQGKTREQAHREVMDGIRKKMELWEKNKNQSK